MSVLPVGFGSSSSSGIDTGDIEHSLRFRGAQYIATTLTTAATSTYFILFKQAKLGAINPLFDTNIKINANDTITAFGLTTTAVKRDPIGWHWMHVSNNGLVVDGVNLGAVTTSALTNPRIGYDGTNYANMYGARVCCVSGSSLAYTDFVTFNTTTNEWVVKTKSAIKALVDAGGSAGFMYEFDDATSLTTLGNDYSSKNNDGTLTGGFSLTAGTTYDHMLDVPGNSYAVLSPIDKASNTTISDANLKTENTNALTHSTCKASIAFDVGNATGYTWEVIVNAASNLANGSIGACPATQAPTAPYSSSGVVMIEAPGNVYKAGALQGTYLSYTTSDIIKIWMSSGNLYYSVNGTSANSGNAVATGLGGDYVAADFRASSTAATCSWVYNFGQYPFATGATYHSAAGGYFRYAPPTGFKALCQANLPDVAIKNPKLHFDIKTRTGTAATYSVTGLGFQPDLVWSKSRGRALDHALYDSVRGVQKQLESNTTSSETTEATGLTAFNSDGYTGGALDQINGTTATNSFVDWLWKAGGAAVSNTAGSITSQVSANVDAGFSIVTYTGTGANATVGHGLTKVPKLVIAKQRTAGTVENWAVSHTSIANTEYLLLNTTAAKTAGATYWNSTTPTTSVFSVGSAADTNESAKDFVAYCFADIEGYSKAFSYTGNGSADGPYVHLGFKPRWLLIKRSDSAADWILIDTARDPYNHEGMSILYPNSASAEYVGGLQDVDLLSNGFKPRDTHTAINASSGTYIGFAIADVAGKYSLAR